MEWRIWKFKNPSNQFGKWGKKVGLTSEDGLFSVYKRESGKWSVWQRQPTVMLVDGFDTMELAQAWCMLHLTLGVKPRPWLTMTFKRMKI